MDTPCYLAALRILQYRFNSEAELRRKLRVKKFDGAAIDAALARLRDERWLDDARFAEAFVRTRLKKHIGRLRIARELREAGVDDETARAALSANADEDLERASLRAVRDKRTRSLVRRHGAEFVQTAEGRNKVAAYLLKQGYDAALVREVVGEGDDGRDALSLAADEIEH